MPTDIERLDGALDKARQANRDTFASYRKMVEALDVVAMVVRNMKRKKTIYHLDNGELYMKLVGPYFWGDYD